MKIVYVTRRHNRSGFYILRSLINHGIYPEAVVLKNEFQALDKPVLCNLVKAFYYVKCHYYRNEPWAFLESEELLARRHGIKVINTPGMKDPSFLPILKSLDPDITILGGGWPELIPKSVIQVPRYGVLNTHPSLLPEYRGTSITRWQVLHGKSESGVTIHFVDDQFDTGDILLQRSLEVGDDETPQSLFDRLSHMAAEMMVEIIENIDFADPSRVPRVPQDKMQGQYFSRWSWNLDKLAIDWSLPLQQVHNFIRANNQESYEFPGPIFCVGQETFIARTSCLSKVSPEHRKEYVGQNPYLGVVNSNGWQVFKPRDPHILHISKVQRFDHWRWQRAVNPVSFRSITQGTIIRNLDTGFLSEMRGA